MKKLNKTLINQGIRNKIISDRPSVDNLSKSPKMLTFDYRAKSHDGKTVSGQISAHNTSLAKARLRKQGFYHIHLTAKRMRWHVERPIANKQILLSLRTLATLLKSGVVLTDALDIAANTTTNRRLSNKLIQIKQRIEQGESFTQAISAHPEFGSLTLALIDAGEKSGALDIMLERAAEYAEHQALRQSQLNQALRYPAAIALTAIIVSTVMLLKVVPSFAVSFGSMGDELPTLTLWVLSLSQWLSAHFWQLLLVLASSIGLFVYVYKTSARLRLWCAKTAFGLPIFGKLIQAVGSARFAQTLSTTFGSGVPLAESILLAGRACDHVLFLDASKKIAKAVKTGTPLGQAMADAKLFSPMSVQMVTVGEASGRLSEMLDQVARHHDKEVKDKTDTLIGMIEPAIILIMGVLIGGLVLAMYLPIFNMSMGA